MDSGHSDFSILPTNHAYHFSSVGTVNYHSRETTVEGNLETIKRIVKFMFSENLASKPGNILIRDNPRTTPLFLPKQISWCIKNLRQESSLHLDVASRCPMVLPISGLQSTLILLLPKSRGSTNTTWVNVNHEAWDL